MQLQDNGSGNMSSELECDFEIRQWYEKNISEEKKSNLWNLIYDL